MRRATGSGFLAIALLLAGSRPAPAAPEPSARDDVGFRKSMDLLQVQMKLKVLQTLAQKGYFVPPAWVGRYVQEQQELAEEMGAAEDGDLGDLEIRAEEADKVEKAKANEMLKLAESWGKKALKEGRNAAEVLRDFELKRVEWRKQSTVRADGIALYVQQASAKLKNETLGTEWEHAVRELYCGAIQDRDTLLEGIVKLEKERVRLQACMDTLKEVEEKLKKLEDIRKSPAEKVEKAVREKLVAHLKARYGELDKATEENIEWSMGKTRELLESGWETWSKLKELDEDRVLKENPTALKTAKGFAVLGAVYKNTLGVVKDFEVVKALGPLVDFLEFYGEAISLVPDIAHKLQGLTAKIDQDMLSLRKLSAFGQLPDHLGPFWDTLLHKHYGIEIALEHDQTTASPSARYALIVPDDKNLPGYTEITQPDYDRLAQALADERVLDASEEVSRSIWGAAMDGFYGDKQDSPLSADPAKGYLESLEKAAKTSPFPPGDLKDLARGFPVTYKDKAWTAATLRERCEARMNILAEEMAVREALSEYRASYRDDWKRYKALLAAQDAALSPQQALRLFNHYVRSGPGHVTAYLKRVAEERRARRLGQPRVGIYRVSIPPDDVVAPGGSASVAADLMVIDLAPGRSMPAKIAWTLPAWAGGSVSQNIILANGHLEAHAALKVPAGAPKGEFEVKVALTAPLGEGRPPLERTASARFRIEDRPHDLSATIKVEHDDYRKMDHHYTQIRFRSSALASPGNQSLVFRVYGSPSPEGPWENFDWASFTSGNDQSAGSSGRRVDSDTAEIELSYFDRRKFKNKPYYFQIAQELDAKRGTDAPRDPQCEVYSTPLPPAPPKIGITMNTLVMPFDYLSDLEGEVYEFPRDNPLWEADFCFRLSQPDQCLNYQGVPFTIQIGNQTLHAWSGRETAVYTKTGTHELGTPGWVVVRLPLRLGSWQMKIQAESPDGQKVSRTLTLRQMPPQASAWLAAASRKIEDDPEVTSCRKDWQEHPDATSQEHLRGVEADKLFWLANDMSKACQWDRALATWMDSWQRGLTGRNSEGGMDYARRALDPEAYRYWLLFWERETPKAVEIDYPQWQALANLIAMVTGDRQKAAACWVLGTQKELHDRPGSSESKRPAWWPEGKLDAPPPASGDPGDVQALIQHAHQRASDSALSQAPTERPVQPPQQVHSEAPQPPPSPTDPANQGPASRQPRPNLAAAPQRPLPDPSGHPSTPPPAVAAPVIPPAAQARHTGDAALQKGDLQAALQAYNEAIKADPAAYAAYVGRAHTQSLRGFHDWAIADFRKALTLDADPFAAAPEEVRHYLVDLLILTGKLDQADRELLALEKAGPPGAWGLFLRGQYFLKKGDRESAAKSLGEASRLDPNLGKSFYDQAYRWIEGKQTDRALLIFDTLECMDPGHAAMFHYCRGQAYAAAGRKAEAIAALRRNLELDPEGEMAQQAREAIASLEGR